MIGIIYKYTSPNGKNYIGQTIHEDIRKNRHKKAAINGVDNKFYRAVRKYGWDNFKYEVIFTIDSNKPYIDEKLDYMERYYIRKYDSLNNGYNMTPGGEGGGFKHSDEFKQQLSARMKVNNPAYNMTDEWRANIGKANKGKKMSDTFKQLASIRMKENNPMKNPEVVKKRALSMLNTHLSDEHKKAISNSCKGKKLSEETKHKMSLSAQNRKRDARGHFIKTNLQQ